MAAITWTGAFGTLNWNEPANWSPQSVPTPDDDVTIPSGPTHDAPQPPSGVRIRSLRMTGGGLSGRLAVTELFIWLGGSLQNGIDLNGARIEVSNRGSQNTAGSITSASAVLSTTEIGLKGGARLVNNGLLTSTGDVTLVWQAGAPTFLVSQTRLRVESGTLTLRDVIGRLGRSIFVAPGAVLNIASATEPSVLEGTATVTGGGALRVGDGGQLFAVRAARVVSGTILELAAGGVIVDQRTGDLAIPIVGPISGRQGLVVEGQLRWIGGRVDGDSLIGPQAVLRVEGPDTKFLRAGTMQVRGSGALAGPGQLDVDNGTLRNDGDLLLEAGLAIGSGRTFRLDNRGTLRIGGIGTVRFGDNELLNRGTIEVHQGLLHLALSGHSYNQQSGRLVVAATAELRCDNRLEVAVGSLEGAGRLTADVVSHDRAIPGGLGTPGRLTIRGNFTLADTGRLRIRVNTAVPGAGHGQLAATRTVRLGGAIEVDAPTYVPGSGDVLDVVTADPTTTISGRFTRAVLPPPAGGRFLRIAYEGSSVRLLASVVTPGFDVLAYPGDGVMSAWLAGSPYRWVGYYLIAPCRPTSGWIGRRAFLAGSGWGLAIIYVGQQETGGPCPQNDLDRTTGRLDAQDAVDKTTAEGFAAGSWIYLDVEGSQGPALDPNMAAYAGAWVEEMLRIGTFNPAIYCHRKDFADLFPSVIAPFSAVGRRDRPRFWITGGPGGAGLGSPPAGSGIPEATMWQQPTAAGGLDHPETHAGTTLTIDSNVSVLPNPSAP